MGEGAHLGPREAGVGVAQAQAAQAEPLVGALEVGLDLGGGQDRPRALGGNPLVRRRDARALLGLDAPGRGDALGALAGRRDAGARDVLAHERLGPRDEGAPEDARELSDPGICPEAVARLELGHHDRGVALLAVRPIERPLGHEGPARGAHRRRKAGAGEVHGLRRPLDAVRLEQRGQDVVRGRDRRRGRGLAEKHDGVDGAGREPGCRARGHDARDAGRARGPPLESQRGARAREGRGRELDQLGKAHAPLGRRVCRDAELLQALGDAEKGGEGRRRLGRGGGADLVTLNVGGKELGGGRPQPAAQELARRGGDLRGDVALGLQLGEHGGGREQAVAAPCGVEVTRAAGVGVRDVAEQEVGELARRPPGHVREAHARGARLGGVRHRLGRGPGAREVRQAGDGSGKLQEGAAGLERAHLREDLPPSGHVAGGELVGEEAPRLGGVRRDDGDLARAAVREAAHLARDQLGLCGGARRQQHAHGAGRCDRLRVAGKERVEKGGELRGAVGGLGRARPARLGDARPPLRGEGAQPPREGARLGEC